MLPIMTNNQLKARTSRYWSSHTGVQLHQSPQVSVGPSALMAQVGTEYQTTQSAPNIRQTEEGKVDLPSLDTSELKSKAYKISIKNEGRVQNGDCKSPEDKRKDEMKSPGTSIGNDSTVYSPVVVGHTQDNLSQHYAQDETRLLRNLNPMANAVNQQSLLQENRNFSSIHSPYASEAKSPTQNINAQITRSPSFTYGSIPGHNLKPDQQLGASAEHSLRVIGSNAETNALSGEIFTQDLQKTRPGCLSESPEKSSEIQEFTDAIRSLDSPVRRNKVSKPQRSTSLSFSTLAPIEEDLASSKESEVLFAAENEAPREKISAEQPQPVSLTPTLSPLISMDFLKTSTKKEILTPGQMMKRQLEEKPKVGLQRASAENSIVFQSNLFTRTKVEPVEKAENKETINGKSRWSWMDSSTALSDHRKPGDTFSSHSLELVRKSRLASGSPIESPAKPKLANRSQSQEDISKVMAFSDQLPTTPALSSSFNGRFMESPGLNLPFTAPDWLRTDSMTIPRTDLNLQPDIPFLTTNLEHQVPPTKQPPKVNPFPTAQKSKLHEQGKINPRPGKIIIYENANFTGYKKEITADVSDSSGWTFPPVISIKVVRGCWVAYEKADYKGKKFAFEEGEVELTDPWAEPTKGDEEPTADAVPTKPVTIGSLKRAIKQYSAPEISLFAEPNGEGRKLMFCEESEDIRIFGYQPKTASIIVNSGLWLVYCEPFFEGQACVLELGGFRNLQEWGGETDHVGSLLPLQMGGPCVEKLYEPKVILYEKSYFSGRRRESYSDSTDFLSRYPNNNQPIMNAGSIKVIGGIWVGYSKEGFRGEQYILEEGEYQDWQAWGGFNEELKSLRLIRGDFANPALVLYNEVNCEEGECVNVMGSVPDLKDIGFEAITQSINVQNGVWVAYEGVYYSGPQYILEKGIYRHPEDWGAKSCKISSLHPILLADTEVTQAQLKIQLFSEYDFNGYNLLFDKDKPMIARDFKMNSCRVLNGSWALYENQDFTGNMFVVEEGEYPDLPSMGCRMTTHIRSAKTIPYVFSEPQILLYSLEAFEGKEIELTSEVKSLAGAGYNNLVLSLRVTGGVWVAFEHSHFRGRQMLLEPHEVSNWPKYSKFPRIGSLAPIVQKRAYFKIRNQETDEFLSINANDEDMKSCRVVVAKENKELHQIWFYDQGMIKPKMAPDMSLQTIGSVDTTGTKVVIWSDTRLPKHCWNFGFNGPVSCILHPQLVLDIKGGKSYDRDSAIICSSSETKPTQVWNIQLL
eukprot:gi/632954680/ref/XP_007893089.1/ PREDICTED: absent in melanoma 1-like protein [Callorhinchus milii]